MMPVRFINDSFDGRSYSNNWLEYSSNLRECAEKLIIFLADDFSNFVGNAIYCHRSIVTHGLARLNLT